MCAPFRVRAVWTVVLVVLAAGWWIACCPAAAAEPSEGFGTGSPPPAENPKREKMVKDFMRQLGRLKPFGSTKKDLDDFFLVGTAELNPATRHADVRFEVKQGQREVAEFVVDYVLGAQTNAPRKWHVFFRLKDSEKAEQALQFTRSQYDQMASYRQTIARTYNAKTVRRT